MQFELSREQEFVRKMVREFEKEKNMKFKTAKIFSSGTEYMNFKYNYCENGCIFHKEREDGGVEFTENGGCPIENGTEDARFDRTLFPNVLLEVWTNDKCINWHYCPFYTKGAKE